MVVDTGIFIDFLRSKDKTKTILQRLPGNIDLYVSSITLYELYMGATSPQKWVDVKTLTEDIPVLNFTKNHPHNQSTSKALSISVFRYCRWARVWVSPVCKASVLSIPFRL